MPGLVSCQAVRLTGDQPMLLNYSLSSNTDHNRSHKIVRSIPKSASTKLPARVGRGKGGTAWQAGLACHTCLHLMKYVAEGMSHVRSES